MRHSAKGMMNSMSLIVKTVFFRACVWILFDLIVRTFLGRLIFHSILKKKLEPFDYVFILLMDGIWVRIVNVLIAYVWCAKKKYFFRISIKDIFFGSLFQCKDIYFNKTTIQLIIY